MVNKKICEHQLGFDIPSVDAVNMYTIGPFIRGKLDASYIRRALNKTRTFRINGTFRLK